VHGKKLVVLHLASEQYFNKVSVYYFNYIF